LPGPSRRRSYMEGELGGVRTRIGEGGKSGAELRTIVVARELRSVD